MKKRFMPRRKDGFTLIITIMLMTMLTLLSIGMLTLGAVTLRSGSVAENKRTANANAQMALMFAIGELQKQLGDDRRITADASILKSGSSSTESPQGHLVGVWTSDNPYAETTTQVGSISAPKYDKTTTFKKWLISSPKPSETEQVSFGTGSAPSGPTLFSAEMDGYEITSEPVPILTGDNKQGAYAWAVSQENTKAKINVGTDFDRSTYNMSVQAPTRPDLKVGQVIKKQPTDGWVDRNGKVISMSQAVLDPGFGIDKDQLKTLGPDYTATAQGVLADVAKGRLKTDLSLAFEMSASDYKKSNWGTINNPFAEGFAGDTPLFTPTQGSGFPLTYPIDYDAASYTEAFFASAPPTFGTLRSYYRMYRHLYNAGGGSVTAFQRPQASNYWTKIGDYPAQVPTDGGGNNTSVGPILDRILMVVCEYVTPSGQAAIVFSPIITLWNPYNTGIDVDGMVAYPFMDLPGFFDIIKNGVNAGSFIMSKIAGLNRKGDGGGRQQEPYFYCQITNDGTSSMGTPIHFAAGEVKVFQPVSAAPILFSRAQALSSNAPLRVIPMMPVTASVPVTKVRGGIAYAMNQGIDGGDGVTVGRSDTLGMRLTFQLGAGSTYRYGIALEDSTRITNKYANNLEKAARFWNEIHVIPNPTAFIPITSPNLPAGPMSSQPQVVAVIESYHRTELKATGTTTAADLLLSSNPRQRYQHPNLAPTTSFKNGTGPHYETHVRQVSNFAGLNLQTSADGTRSYYGASNNSGTGKDYLSLFDLPREPQMSIGAFQNAELTDLVSAPAYQFGNSWASPFITKSAPSQIYRRNNVTGKNYTPSLGMYDTSYLANCAVWDGYYFSSAAPIVSRRQLVGSKNNYANDQDQINETYGTSKVISDWIDNPTTKPLRNTRYMLHMGNMNASELKSALADPKGARDISAHIMVDGAFNVNSTSVKAWESVLASLKGDSFAIEGMNTSGNYKSGDNTPFPRMRYPAGPVIASGGSPSIGDKWNAFRELSDDQIRTLAEKIVDEVKSRGPFLSLGEFVNRRLASTDLGLSGAVQSAIDNAALNAKVAGDSVTDLSPWGSLAANFKKPVDVATATPGWLTQADVLTPLAPIITVRSDTFTVRAYGEAQDDKKNVTARSWCEATVQRMPEFLDESDEAGFDLAQRSKINTTFGRQFQIVSFRWITPQEILGETTTA